MNSPNRFWVTLSAYLAPPSERQDEGAGIIEYAAIVILVAAIAMAVFALGVPSLISDAISTAIDDALSGP
ncbi:hypothetical protein [Nocardiopsis sp. CA-288880]|uniref:hypothetical protein n=1 Tax=Nocardiopsis sp. CA-288880 TaxID=3239995 RepID=UPI003D96557F